METGRRTTDTAGRPASHRRPCSAWPRRALSAAGLLLALVASGLAPAPALAAGPATNLALVLAPTTITADGVMSSTATVTVTDGSAHVPGERVTIASDDPADSVGAVAEDAVDHTYSATITSTHAGTSTITATDQTAPTVTPDSKPLTKTPGPAAHIAVQLTPSSILASGSSTSTVTATVTDANGNRVPGAAVTFKPAAQLGGGGATDHGDGTYTATYTSTTSAGPVTITATAGSASGQATLNQAAFGSATTLSATPSAAVTNQSVTLVAIVTASGGGQAPKGTITFQDNGVAIAGCAGQPVAAVAPLVSQITCQAPFGASALPHQLTAVFTSGSANVADSTGAGSLAVGPSSTSTALDVSNPSLAIGSNATYTARISPSHTGPIVPGGSVAFSDAGQAIPACAAQRVVAAFGQWLATCTVRYPLPGSHSITARYGGDANFGASASPSQTVTIRKPPVVVLGTITATMQWSFFYTPRYTAVRSFVVNGAPVGAVVLIACQGRGCPFGARAKIVRAAKACTPKNSQKCRRPLPGVVSLMPGLQHRRLKPGTRIVVKITRPNWIGKYYRFTIRAARPPAILISCLAPAGVNPGVGC